MGIDKPTGGEAVEQEAELLRKQAEAIEIAEKLGPRYKEIRKDDDRCERALKFARANMGRVLTFDEVSPELAALDASNKLTAHENDGIQAVEAALHSLHNPRMGYDLAKRAERDLAESGE